MAGAAGLYIHIPFCTVKCRFCHFSAFPGLRGQIPKYLSALRLEMRRHRGRALDTVFVGGGTPTALSAEELQTLFAHLRENFALSKNCEITVECHPESATAEKMASLRAAGANRVSFGLQATEDAILRKIGRTHDFKRFLSAWDEAGRAGFANRNVDLIYGLPGQTARGWESSLAAVIALEPEHVSAYALDVEEKTAFFHENVRPDDELQAEMYRLASDRLQSSGYEHYEISNFAKPGRRCRHNLRTWRNRPCLGVGASAVSFDGGVRSRNLDSVPLYIGRMESGRPAAEESESLRGRRRLGESFMLRLRLKEGAALTRPHWDHFGPILRKYRSLGLLHIHSGRSRAALTRRGWILSNQIFREILAESP